MSEMTVERAEKMMAVAKTLLELEEADALMAIEIASNMRSWRNRRQAQSEQPEQPEQKKTRRGPDKRGTFKCHLCGKVLPTRRGRGLHLSRMHRAP